MWVLKSSGAAECSPMRKRSRRLDEGSSNRMNSRHPPGQPMDLANMRRRRASTSSSRVPGFVGLGFVAYRKNGPRSSIRGRGRGPSSRTSGGRSAFPATSLSRGWTWVRVTMLKKVASRSPSKIVCAKCGARGRRGAPKRKGHRKWRPFLSSINLFVV